MSKVIPCGHPVPKGRKVCDRCKKARRRARRLNRYYNGGERKAKVMKG